MPLNALKAKQAKPKERDYKISDEKGLYLHIKISGAKYWRLKYRIAGKEKLLALGVYPIVSLKEARERRDEARIAIANGLDPSEIKRNSKLNRINGEKNNFKITAYEWYEKQFPQWSDSHSKRVKNAIDRDLSTTLGNRPIISITHTEILDCLRKIEARGSIETAHRVKQIAGQIFRYAVATGRAERDPTSDLKGALPAPQKNHLAAITDPEEVGKLLLAIDSYEGSFTVQNALKLAPLVFVRPTELRHAELDEINLDDAEWLIPAKKMKSKRDHIVPLSKQAANILENQLQLTMIEKYVFPSARSLNRPMSDNAILVALRSMGIPKEKMSGHGFRAMARTLLDEELGFPVDIIEHQLAHAVKDRTGRAYNRTSHLVRREEMMQKWADYLDSLKKDAEAENLISGYFNKQAN
ncbi:MAG: integrase arm-type DNA-binding domain-containing protein [Gammaproteobacteria bacterium]|nr:integrase arm-type DNA-binding domain-containing protein [Gammaproteobacteria bacterium]